MQIRCGVLALVTAGLLTFSPSAFAQQGRGNVQPKLTDAQKSEIDSIVHASNTEMRSLAQNMQSDREGTMAKLAEHRKETLSKVESKLTDEQKTTWKEMLGAPFDIKYEPRPGGRPGGGGGR